MTVEELLLPRYKIIATWPGMHTEPFHVSQVVTLQPYEDEDYKGFIHIPVKHMPGSFMREGFFKGYPHLFQPLQWWEERKPDEFPKYIESKDGKWVREVIELAPEGFKARYPESPKGYRICYNDRWLPATREEYETFINNK